MNEEIEGFKTVVLACGDASNGQLGIEQQENNQGDQKITSFVPIKRLEGVDVKLLSCGDKHSCILSSSGSLFTFGENEAGQLARDSRLSIPSIVTSLESVIVTNVSCGSKHTIITIESSGDVLAFGSNEFGQLGLGESFSSQASVNSPKVIKSLRGKCVKDISCGSNHSLALTCTGETFVWGDGLKGQLAKFERKSCVPIAIKSLMGLPITKIASGGYHSFAITVSGFVYAWGANDFGQLGLGDKEDRFLTCENQYFRNKKIVFISCGLNHSACLSASGQLFTFGQGTFYQLGHGNDSNLLQPTPIQQFEGMNVIEVNCGRNHTICVRKRDNGSLATYSWGANNFGQLGTGNFESCQIPNLILPDSKTKEICCGGDFSLISCQISNEIPTTTRNSSVLNYIDLQIIEKLLSNPNSCDLIKKIEEVFSFPSCLNASFLNRSEVYQIGPKKTGLDISSVKLAYTKMIGNGSEQLFNILLESSSRAAGQILAFLPTQQESLRSIFILLQNSLLLNPNKQTLPILDRLTKAISSLGDTLRYTFIKWSSILPQENFLHMLEIVQRFLVFIFGVFLDPRDVFTVLSLLYESNEEGHVVPYTSFYNSIVSRNMDIRSEYSIWRSNTHAQTILNYPFILDPISKSAIFDLDAMVQQQQSAFSLFGQVLLFHIHRETLIEDALNCISSLKHPALLKAPLKVIFLGEQAIDEGGVRKEFFQLCVRKIFDPDLGLFIYNKESGTYFFNNLSFECSSQFNLIGLLCGLAIFNRVLLDIRFPLIVYKLMLGKTPTLQDAISAFPIVGNNLKKLLEYSGDVEEDFGLTFSVSFDYFGETRIINLKEDGKNIPVTNVNRAEYVELYIDYICHASVKKQFDPFVEGFESVAGGPVLELFRAEELENLICGEISSSELDFSQLQSVCQYEGGYHSEHQTIKNFWEVAKELPQELKKKLLTFATGSDRIPVGGLKSMKFMIQREGPNSNRLPSASTCFNILLLPEYSTKEKLKYCLITAIQNCEGFGLK